MIKALIFDFDGLILDTEWPDYQSWQETFAAFGGTLALSAWAATIGTHGTFDPYADLERQLGHPIDRAAVRARRRARFAELMEQQSILPGVERSIREARSRGLKLGIASSSSQSWVAGYLARHGLHACFDCLACSDHVARVKPAPDLYLAALRSLGVQPHEAIAFEDSPNGAMAAASAGIFCVAIPNRLTRRLAIGAALQLASLDDISLEQLLARAGCASSGTQQLAPPRRPI